MKQKIFKVIFIILLIGLLTLNFTTNFLGDKNADIEGKTFETFQNDSEYLVFSEIFQDKYNLDINHYGLADVVDENGIRVENIWGKIDNYNPEEQNLTVNEYVSHQLILENIDVFLKELGVGFMYFGSEVKIKIGDRYNYMDFLLFNYKFNCFVVIELKVTEMRAEYIGQVMKYINYVDKHIKEQFNDKTVGIIICKKENKFVMEYCTDHRIFTTTYELEGSDISKIKNDGK